MALRFDASWLDRCSLGSEEILIDASVDLQRVSFRVGRRLALDHIKMPEKGSFQDSKLCWEKTLKGACSSAYMRSTGIATPIEIEARDFEHQDGTPSKFKPQHGPGES